MLVSSLLNRHAGRFSVVGRLEWRSIRDKIDKPGKAAIPALFARKFSSDAQALATGLLRPLAPVPMMPPLLSCWPEVTSRPFSPHSRHPGCVPPPHLVSVSQAALRAIGAPRLHPSTP